MSKPLVEMVDHIPADMDQFYVGDRDPDKYYAWLNKKPESLEKNKFLYGYEIIKTGDKEVTLVAPNAVGERVIGDLVLAWIPRTRYERIERMRKAAADGALAKADEAFKATVERGGMEVEDTTQITKQALNAQSPRDEDSILGG